MDRVRPLLAVAAAWWLVADCAAVWGPSLITVFGQAASTPPEQMGLFALGCILAAGVLALAPGRPHGAPVVVLGIALLARLVLAFTPGGQVQLWASSLGVAAGFAWFAHVAGRDRSLLAPGLATGWLCHVAAAAAGGTWLAVWRTDALGVATTVVLVLLNLVGLTAVTKSSGGILPVSTRQAWSVLPVALVAGVAVVNPGRASTADPVVGPFLLVVGCALAVALLTQVRLATTRGVRTTCAVTAPAAVALSLLGTGWLEGVPNSLSPWALASFVLGPTALAGLLTADPTPRINPAPADPVPADPARADPARTPTPTARTTALRICGGAVVWVVLFFAYYAGYDLGYRADAVLVVAAAVLALWALWPVWSAFATRGPNDEEAPAGAVPGPVPSMPAPSIPDSATPDSAAPDSAVPVPATAALLGLALVVAGIGAVVHRPPSTVPPPTASLAQDDGIRIVAWNLRMGYGMDGTFDPEEVAKVIGEADVVLLSEIDRGWLLNGGQDQLAILSRETGLPFHFAPAADPVWGDAVLSRLPVEEVRGRPLPSYGAVTGAGALAARLSTGSGSLWVVSTHVQPTDTREDGTIGQAEDLAAFVEDLSREAGETPVVLGGDFNFEPGTPSFDALTGTGLVDSLAEVRPLPTSDAADPVKEIDHLFHPPSWEAVAAGTVPTHASDHLPVWADLAPR